MLKKTVMRLLLTVLFALVGMIVGVGSIRPLSTVVDLPGNCMRGQMVLGMLVGSVLGGLLGCAIAVPRMATPIPKRFLSFVLASATALLGLYAVLPILDSFPPQYDLASLVILLVVILPTLSLFGFSIPMMLSRETPRPAEEGAQVGH